MRYMHWLPRLYRLCAAMLALAAALPVASHASTQELAERADVRAFIHEMVVKHGFSEAALTHLFDQATLRPDIIRAISSPAEAKPWYEYRPIFLTPSRIAAGVRFWDQHADDLARAEHVYGVPAKIVVAIIGVETRFGTYKGKYRVLDALTTLAFDYPKRSTFFRQELEQFLLLTKEEGVDPLSLNGSYAGAMGGPQFISSSYRHYAVDFDHDGKRDLWNSYADMIGSVANYFHEHGWQAGEPVARRIEVAGNQYKALDNGDLKPQFTVAQVRRYGVSGATDLPAKQPVAFITLEARNGAEHWLGLHNFYVITRYNHSPLYAMAVYQLANAIEAERGRRLASKAEHEAAAHN
ncbi:MAG: lytic murein transglycosylase B [Gammaproteobacteria bacterium]